jgi:lysophospholipase L1-like esterase
MTAKYPATLPDLVQARPREVPVDAGGPAYYGVVADPMTLITAAADEVEAIAAELGTNPSGSATTVAARFTSLDTRLSPGIRVAMLGDSITAGGGLTYPQVDNIYTDSPLVHTIMAAKGRLRFGGQFAVPGYASAQVLATLTPQAVAAAPDVCIVLTGTNDYGTSPDFKTNIPLIVSALRTAGITPVLCTLPPSSNASTNNFLRPVSRWVRDYANLNGLALLDFQSVLTDPATGLYLSGHNADITHPNAKGYRVMGQYAAPLVQGLVQPGTTFLAADPYDTTNASVGTVNSCIGDALFTTDTGGIPNGGWYVAAGSATRTMTTDAAFVGRVHNVAVTGGATAVLSFDVGAAAWTFQPGHRVAVSFRMSTTGMEAAGATFNVSVGAVGRSSGPANILSFKTASDVTAETFYFESVVPPGTTSLQVQVRNDGGSGAFSYRFGQISVIDLDLYAV